MAAAATEFPHLVALDRMMGLPMIELALTKSAETYSRVKNFHRLMYGAFTTVEMSLNTATKLAMPIAKPIATRLENQIHFVDDKLCRGLDKIEEKVPLVKEKPEQIVQDTYVLALQTISPAIMGVSYVNHMIVEQAEILRDATWKKTNQVLDTYYGNTAVKGIVNTSVLIDHLLDEYFPPIEGEETIDIKTAEEDKLLHVLQTIGCLTTKATKRIYSYVIHHFGIVKKDYVVPYINQLVEFLYITRNLHEANAKRIEKNSSRMRRKSNCEKHALKFHIINSNATLTLLESKLPQADVKIEHHTWTPCAKGVIPLVTRFTEMKNIKVTVH